jgi:hypothetical protein
VTFKDESGATLQTYIVESGTDIANYYSTIPTSTNANYVFKYWKGSNLQNYTYGTTYIVTENVIFTPYFTSGNVGQLC